MSVSVAAERLRSFVERIERVDEEIAASRADRKEIFAEAKAEGYDAATLRKCVRERGRDPGERKAQLDLFDLYWSALGESE